MLVLETQDPVQNYRLQIHKFEATFQEVPQSFLSSEELEYLQILHHEKRRNEYLQSRFALKLLIAQKTGLAATEIRFKKMGEGKPVLHSSTVKLDFNLSHSGEFFAIALSEKGYVGVDIEKIRPPQHLTQIAKKFFSAQEQDLILNEQDPQRQARLFTKFWSGKEALIKTLGGGVFKNVHDVEIDGRSWQIQKLPAAFNSLSRWQLHFYEEIKGFVCSIAFNEFPS